MIFKEVDNKKGYLSWLPFQLPNHLFKDKVQKIGIEMPCKLRCVQLGECRGHIEQEAASRAIM
jgi:hypothetical protein